MQQNDKPIFWDGKYYVSFHGLWLAGGPFLPPSLDFVDDYVELPPESEFRHNVTSRNSLSAAQVHGDSMKSCGIHHNDIVFFGISFPHVEHNQILIIEKVADNEGFGSWSLKRLIIEKPRSSRRDEFGNENDWDEPDILLRSHNPDVQPWQLDPEGQYKVRGIYQRAVLPHELTFINADWLWGQLKKIQNGGND